MQTSEKDILRIECEIESPKLPKKHRSAGQTSTLLLGESPCEKLDQTSQYSERSEQPTTCSSSKQSAENQQTAGYLVEKDYRNYISARIIHEIQRGFELTKMLPPYAQVAQQFESRLLLSRDLSTKSLQRTLVLDLDETLIHCEPQPFIGCHEAIFFKSPDGQDQIGYISFRPYLQNFITTMSSLFEIAVFTASKKDYANAVIDRLDPEGKLIQHSLYRDDCLNLGNVYVKDLNRLGRDLSKTIIVDNSAISFGYHLTSGILIPSFFGQSYDSELKNLAQILTQIVHEDISDVRIWLEEKFQLPKKLFS